MPKDEIARLIRDLERRMKQAAKDLEFEKAAALRDQLLDLRKALVLDEDARIPELGERAAAIIAGEDSPPYEAQPRSRRSGRRRGR